MSSFRLQPLFAEYVPPPIAALLAQPLEHVLALRRLERVYSALPRGADGAAFAGAALAELGVVFEVPDTDRARVPRTGPLVVVANHPFGGVEGLFLLQMLLECRPDVRVLGNTLLGRIPEIAPYVLPVDVLRTSTAAARANALAARRALRWLGDGHVLAIFPAGEVSARRGLLGPVRDRAWPQSVARLIRLARAAVLPVYFDGANGAAFQAAGLLHPRLRTALLPHELLNKRRRRLRVRIGTALSPPRVEAFAGDDPLLEHLRLRVYALGCDDPRAADAGARPRRRVEPSESVRRGTTVDRVAVDAAIPAARLAAEVAGLPASRRLACVGGLEAWCASAVEIPWTLQEIGRLRELTFRAVGEGTGRARDVDPFDDYYEHLFVWNPATREVAGGYRIGAADALRRRYGVRGLYTHTLFEYGEPLLRSLGPALELGRSFVRAEYQRTFAPLLLLWKGIGAYVAARPEHAVLFGPVSISDAYSVASKALLTEYLRAQYSDAFRSRLVRGRHPLPDTEAVRRLREELRAPVSAAALEGLVRAFDGEAAGMPVLVRQYLKLGARVLAFNVDAAFGNAIDVLMAVDLRRTEDAALARYMGQDGLAAFRSAQPRRPRATAA